MLVEQMSLQEIEEKVEFLNTGETMLTHIRPVKGDKFQVEIVEKLVSESANNALALLNFDDERFSQGSARRGYLTASKQGIKVYFGIDVDALESEDKVAFSGSVYQVYPIGMMNPILDEKPIRLQIVEKLQTEVDPNNPSYTWKFENIKSSAKQDGNGNYLLKDGDLIFSETIVTNALEIKHVKIQHNSTTKSPEDFIIPRYRIEETETSKEIVKEKVKDAVEAL